MNEIAGAHKRTVTSSRTVVIQTVTISILAECQLCELDVKFDVEPQCQQRAVFGHPSCGGVVNCAGGIVQAGDAGGAGDILSRPLEDIIRYRTLLSSSQGLIGRSVDWHCGTAFLVLLFSRVSRVDSRR